MASIWETRWAEFVRRLTGMHETTALQLVPDVIPSFPIVDPLAAEMYLARRERRAVGLATITSTAPNFAQFRFQNASAGTLLVLERIYLVTSVQDRFNLQPAGVLAGGGSLSGTKRFTDLRGFTPSAPQVPNAVIRQFDAVAGTLAYDGFIGTSNGVVYDEPWTLPPDSELAITANTAGIKTVTAFFAWRERTVHEDELNPTGA